MQKRPNTEMSAAQKLLNIGAKNMATSAAMQDNYKRRVYGVRGRYAMPSPLTRESFVDNIAALQKFTAQDFQNLQELIKALPENQDSLKSALVTQILALNAENYQTTLFFSQDARALESFLKELNEEELNEKAIQETQENPLPHPNTLDLKLNVNGNAASSEAHAGSIFMLIGKLAASFHASDITKFTKEAYAQVTEPKATNLSRMKFFDAEAVSALCQVCGVDQQASFTTKGLTPTFGEIIKLYKIKKNADPNTPILDSQKLATAIEALFEAAYFGSGRAFQSLLDLHQAGIYVFSDEDLCQLVEVQMGWYKISLSALTPRDENGVHYQAYDFADDLRAVQSLPDLVACPTVWKAIRHDQGLFQNVLSSIYHQDGYKALSLLMANEQFDVDVELADADVQQLFESILTLYISARHAGSSVEFDVLQILPKLLPAERYPKLWRALEKNPAKNYQLLNDFYLKLNRELLDIPVVIDEAVRVSRTDEEQAEALRAEAAANMRTSSASLAGGIKNHPQELIEYLQGTLEEKPLRPTKQQFAAQRAEILEAMGRLRYSALFEKLRTPGLKQAVREQFENEKARQEARKNAVNCDVLLQKIKEEVTLKTAGVYDIRPVIQEKKELNEKANKAGRESLSELLTKKKDGLSAVQEQAIKATDQLATVGAGTAGYDRLRGEKDKLKDTMASFTKTQAAKLAEIQRDGAKDKKAYDAAKKELDDAELAESSERRKSMLSSVTPKQRLDKAKVTFLAADNITVDGKETTFQDRSNTRQSKTNFLTMYAAKLIFLDDQARKCYKNKGKDRTSTDAEKLPDLAAFLAEADKIQTEINSNEFAAEAAHLLSTLTEVRNFINSQHEEASADTKRREMLGCIQTLLKYATAVLDKESSDASPLERLTALQTVGNDIRAKILAESASNNNMLTYLLPFIAQTIDFVQAQLTEVNAQAACEKELQALKDREKELVKNLVKNNPVTGFMDLLVLDLIQTFKANHGQGNYDDLKKLILKSLEEDAAVFESGQLAFKRPSDASKAREKFPVFIAANSPVYIKLLAIYFYTQSNPGTAFWKNVQELLIEADGKVLPEDFKVILDGLFKHYPITTDKKKDEAALRADLLKRYTVEDYREPLQTMLDNDVALDLLLIADHQMTKEARLGLLQRLIYREEVAEQYSELSDYLKIEMMLLGDNDAFSYLLDAAETNPVFNVCRKQERGFTLSSEIRHAIESIVDDNDAKFSHRKSVLAYLQSELGDDARFTVLLDRFDVSLAAQASTVVTHDHDVKSSQQGRPSMFGRRSSVSPNKETALVSTEEKAAPVVPASPAVLPSGLAIVKASDNKLTTNAENIIDESIASFFVDLAEDQANSVVVEEGMSTVLSSEPVILETNDDKLMTKTENEKIAPVVTSHDKRVADDVVVVSSTPAVAPPTAAAAPAVPPPPPPAVAAVRPPPPPPKVAAPVVTPSVLSETEVKEENAVIAAPKVQPLPPPRPAAPAVPPPPPPKVASPVVEEKAVAPVISASSSPGRPRVALSLTDQIQGGVQLKKVPVKPKSDGSSSSALGAAVGDTSNTSSSANTVQVVGGFNVALANTAQMIVSRRRYLASDDDSDSDKDWNESDYNVEAASNRSSVPENISAGGNVVFFGSTGVQAARMVLQDAASLSNN